MGKTQDLLIQIKENLLTSPSFINDVPVADIFSCIYYELNEMKQLYDTKHFSEFEQFLLDNAALLQEAITDGNIDKTKAMLDKMIDLHYMIPDIDVALPFIENANFSRALNRHIIDGTIITMGDSHSCFFSGNETLSLIPITNDISTCNQNNPYPFTVLHLGPCLAYNSDRYGSQNMLREKAEWLDENFLINGDTIIFSLGEIDVRTQVYKHASFDDESYKGVVDDILSHYLNLLTWLRDKGYRVICYGPIGSLKDSAPLDEYRPRVGNEAQRNRAGRYYNKRLEELCRENNLEFFTLFYDMVNDDDLTDSAFLGPDEFHLGQYGYQLAISKLKDMGVLI